VNCLLIKISSLGDIIHTLPALTDAHAALPHLRFDWVVEETFAEVPGWHPAVDRVIPVATRRWRRQWWRLPAELRLIRKQIRAREYERIIDAQGLLKSAIAARLARGPRYGLDRRSAREPWASFAYQHPIAIDPQLHAVDRNRALFAACFEYAVPDSPADYGLDSAALPAMTQVDFPTLVFLTGTTWPTKLWPNVFWQRLADTASAAGYRVLLPWGNDTEHDRVSALHGDRLEVLPQLRLSELAAIINQAQGVVAVDSGLGHLAAALGKPCVSIYGATDPSRTGTRGRLQGHVAARFPCAPCLDSRCSYRGPTPVKPACYATVPPQTVWSTLTTLMEYPATA